jgi:predicted DNA-binding transcriptional regulator YafY
VHFTAAERSELMRAAAAAGLDTVMADLRTDTEAPSHGPGFTAPELTGVDGVVFDRLTHAIRHRCRARFVYRDKPRLVHPQTVLLRRGGWYLQAVEEGDDLVKTFAISRIAAVDDDEPGTAVVRDDVPRPQLNPVLWPVDPPIEAVVVTDVDHEAMVVAALGEPTAAHAVDGGRTRLTIPVIHRNAFRQRLYALGARVLLESPEELRSEVRVELTAIAGDGAR